MSDNAEKNTPKPDLSALTDFQFVPDWARNKENFSQKEYSKKEYKDKGFDRDRNKFGPRRDAGKKSGPRPFSREGGERKGKRDFSSDRDRPYQSRRPGGNREGRFERAPIESTPGIRAEIRPINAGLASIAAEVHKHKRCYSLFDLAKVFMGGRDRYEIWYIKEANGPEMIANKKSPGVWLDRKEALSSLWGSPWFSQFYEERSEEIEAPKGQFNSIARCGMSNVLIGPVNWHGYQVALTKLHAEKFSNIPFDKYRSRIVIEKTEEVVAEWLEMATKRNVWAPKRENASDIVLQNKNEVEADFQNNHFDEVFEQTSKCFVPGDIASRNLSPGLFAHLLKLVEVARRHPSHIIPNVCHGLARHHLPIFKWNGGHHTGPSRPHALPDDTQLAERPAAIIDWIKENPGGGIELMITSLAAKAEEAGAIIPEGQPITPPSQTEPNTPVAEEPETTADQATPQAETTPPPAPATEEQVTETPAVEESPVASEPVAESPTLPETERTPEDAPPQQKTEPTPQEDSTPVAKTNLDRLQEAFIVDMMWLLQQGFILVTPEGKAYYPKTQASPQTPAAKPGKTKKKKSKKAPAPAASEESKETEKKVKRTTLKKTGKQTAPSSPEEKNTEPSPAETEEKTETATEQSIAPQEDASPENVTTEPPSTVDTPLTTEEPLPPQEENKEQEKES